MASDRLNILICPDKFKGTFTAQKAAEAIASGWQRVRSQDRLDLLPISDGGDGFGEVLSSLCHADARHADTQDASGRPIRAAWWWQSEMRTAIIESARIIGLALLPQNRYHPFQLDTFGLGAVIQATLDQGAKRCAIGIGGSATNDGGFGLARALGWRFVNPSGMEIKRWVDLPQLSHILPPHQRLELDEFVVAVDVQNPLLGPLGASRVFGPQKGLRNEDMELAEACLGRLAEVAWRDLKSSHANTPGAGAAGGLGFGLLTFAGASPVPGFGMIAEESRIHERIGGSHWVVTGEGAIDASSMMGKAVGEVATLCQQCHVPCIGLGGSVELPNEDGKLFHRLYGIVPRLCDAEQAKGQPAFWLENLASVAAASVDGKKVSTAWD